MLSVSIGRATFSLPPLVIGNDPAAGLWLPEDGMGRPGKRRRNAYAGSSPWLHGQTLTQSVLEQSSLPLTVYAQGADQAALHALQDILEASVGQFTYKATVTENGASRTWRCDPADAAWSDFDSGMSRVFMARAQVTIPVYPFPVSP